MRIRSSVIESPNALCVAMTRGAKDVPSTDAASAPNDSHLFSPTLTPSSTQVLSGDFYQLPPVAKGAAAAGRRFAFEAAGWRRCVDASFQLTTVYRQVCLAHTATCHTAPW